MCQNVIVIDRFDLAKKIMAYFLSLGFQTGDAMGERKERVNPHDFTLLETLPLYQPKYFLCFQVSKPPVGRQFAQVTYYFNKQSDSLPAKLTISIKGEDIKQRFVDIAKDLSEKYGIKIEVILETPYAEQEYVYDDSYGY